MSGRRGGRGAYGRRGGRGRGANARGQINANPGSQSRAHEKQRVFNTTTPSGGPPVAESTRLALHQKLSDFKDSAEDLLALPDLSREERAWVHTSCRDLNLQSKSHGKGKGRTLTVSRIVGKRSVQRLRIRNFFALEATVRALPPTDIASGDREKQGQHTPGHVNRRAQISDSSRHLWPPTRSRDAAVVAPRKIIVPKDIAVRQAALPSRKTRLDILDLINNNQVLILTGETGCGKSTQIPQFCLEHAANHGLDCRIVCTQPRRLAATSIAQRVSQETGTQLGSLVGYNVRLDSNMSSKTHLLYVTAGIFLKMIVGNPDMDGVTHVFVDEVHERSQDTDFSLILLKR